MIIFLLVCYCFCVVRYSYTLDGLECSLDGTTASMWRRGGVRMIDIEHMALSYYLCCRKHGIDYRPLYVRDCSEVIEI